MTRLQVLPRLLYYTHPVFHSNLYWSDVEGADTSAIFPDQLTWAAWRQGGNDTSSLWANPQLSSPGEGGYGLGVGSPAWILGIEQIDTDSIGPSQDVKNKKVSKNKVHN